MRFALSCVGEDRLSGRLGNVRLARCEWLDVLFAVEVDCGQYSIEPVGKPPVGIAEQDHRGWDEHHAHDGGVDED
jgi:hypothetical protein